MVRHTFLLCLLPAALVGCATERSPSETSEETRLGIALPEILDSAFERRDDGPLVVLDRLGEPQHVGAEPVENRHVEGQIDTLRTFHYDGLDLEVYEVADGKQLLQEVRVTGRGYETDDGLGVGSTRAAVRTALGPPIRTEGNVLTYEIKSAPDDPTPTELVVRFEGDRVAAMSWRYYVD